MADNPENLKTGDINAIKITQEVKDFVNSLNTDVQTSADERSEWDNRQDLWSRKRYGIRQRKSFPWAGAANFVIPQIDSDINRMKPAYVNLAYNVSPIVTFEPFGPEDVEPARKRETLFDWRMRTQVKFFQPYTLGIDYMLQYGFTLFKTMWKFKTRKYTEFLSLDDMNQEIVEALFQPEVTDEVLFQIIAEELKPDLTFDENIDEINRVITEFREGETKFEFEFIEKEEDRAEVVACHPRDEVMFPVDTTDIQQARFIDHKFWMNKNDVKLAMKEGKFEKFPDDIIDGWTGKGQGDQSMSAQLRNIRDGVSVQTAEKDDTQILMHEVSTWFDIDGDGIMERVVVNYPDADPESVLRFIENPYEHGQFPYTVVRREINDSNILSSRGIPAIDDDFQTGISTIFNQDIDAQTITNTPIVVGRKNSVKNLRNLRYVPGQVIETENGPADVQILQQGNSAQPNRFNNMTFLKGWANERIGNISAAFSSPVNQPGLALGGKKTATEVDAVASHESILQSLDLQVFQQAMANVYFQIDALYNQFGSDEEYIAITNEEPQRISRREIQGRFNIVPNGRLDDANPNLRLRKLFLIAQNKMQLDPNDEFSSRERLLEFLNNEVDSRMAKKIMLTPQERAQLAQLQQQALENQKAKAKQEAIEAKITEDNLEIRKEALLVPISGKKFAPN